MFDFLFDAFQLHGEELYLVGGFVRDLIIAQTHDDLSKGQERPFASGGYKGLFWKDVKDGKIDVDFATSARPEKTIEILQNMTLKVIPIGIEFGTIQTFIPFGTKEIKVEITTYRCKESYKKGSRKPSVQFGKSLREDLERRDFTINAMAMDRNLRLFDPDDLGFVGLHDVITGILATPIPGVEGGVVSFEDDPLRMLRAYRFETKGFSCGHEVGKAIEKMKKEIHNVSAERIFDEMSKILMAKNPAISLDHMANSGLLGEIFPELQKVVDFKQNQGQWHSKLVWPHTLEVVRQSPQILEVRWAALFHDVAKPDTYSETETGVHFYEHDWKGAEIWNKVADRLKVSTEFKEHVYFLVYEHLQPSLLSSEGPNHTSNKALRRLIARSGDKLENLFHLSLADITSHKPEIVAEKRANCLTLWERCKKLAEEEQIVRLKLPKGTGLVIAEGLGIKPGKKLGEIMRKLEQMLIDGDLTPESDFVKAAKELENGS